MLWIVGPGLVSRSDVFGVVHKSFPSRLVLRSVLFLAFVVSAQLTRVVLLKQVGGGVLSCVVHWICVLCVLCQCTFDKSCVVRAGWCWCWWPEGRSRALPEFLPPTPRKLTHSASRKVIAGHHVNIINITANVPPAILPIFLAY